MTTIRIVTTIITLLAFLLCLLLGVLTAMQTMWMASVVIFTIAGIMSYFVIHDYLKIFKGK